MRKQFWHNAASLGVTMANPFNKYMKQRSTKFGESFNQVNIREVSVQSFGISLSYKFGKLEFKKGESDHNNESLLPTI